MGSARGAVVLKAPLYTGVDQRIEFQFFTDRARKRPMDIGSSAVVLKIKDAGGVTISYSGTVTTSAKGLGYAIITGASHTTAGETQVQLLLDGVPKERYKAEWISAL